MVTFISPSENNGLEAMSDRDLEVYSVGISTGGSAEMRMAQGCPHRQIIATTIDPEGMKFANERIAEAGLSARVHVKLEDVSHPLPYPNAAFDYIYARLVLHYLPREALSKALSELYRVLKSGGKIFVVVRSQDCKDFQGSALDSKTGLTTVSMNGQTYRRFFHTPDSIQGFLISSGFHIQHSKCYQEQLCTDFKRTQLSCGVDALIEVLAAKGL